MATLRQKALARELIQNATADRPKTAGELLESVGYAKNTAEAKPGQIIEQAGVQEELAVLGFTVERAKSVVGEILDDPDKQPKDRLKAADMVFKVHGAYVPELPPSKGNTYNFFFNPDVQKATLAYEENLKRVLAGNAPIHESTDT